MEEKGFTLIELLVVIAIIGILAAIALPEFRAYRVSAFNAKAKTDLRNAITAQEAMYLDIEQYNECSDAGCNHPGLVGLQLSSGVGGSCALVDAGENFQCGFAHSSGDRIYYYGSAAAAFWDTPS